MKKSSIFLKGLIKENPTLVLILGTCPTLATTTSVISAVAMGLAATAVLFCSNMAISALRNIIPDKVRIPCYIVVIAGFVSVVQMLMQAYLPELYDMLGVYLALIVVNCIILGRAESYASKNPVLPSIFDGIGMGLGFTVALTCIGAVREILGAGQIFGHQILPLADETAKITTGFTPITIFVLAPGAFFVLAMLIAAQNAFRESRRKKGLAVKKRGGCLEGDCGACAEGCSTVDEVITAGTDEKE